MWWLWGRLSSKNKCCSGGSALEGRGIYLGKQGLGKVCAESFGLRFSCMLESISEQLM